MSPPRSAPDRHVASDRRGQSEVLGVVLLLGITLIGAGAIVVYGANAIEATTQSADLSRAEHAMTQLDSKASLVAHGSSESQRVSIIRGQQGSLRLDRNAGWMRVVNESAAGDTVLMNASLGAVVYEQGETSIAYQGGGVWRERSGGSNMVSPPEFHYKGRTLTLPLVLVRGEGSISGGTLRVQQNGTPVGKYPTDSADRTNPLTGGEIHVTVKSEYYRAWGRFFEERTGGNASIDNANETATVELVVPTEQTTLTNAIAQTGSGNTLDMQGGGVNNAFVDSYNSSVAPYATSQQDNGTIVTTGDIKLQGNAVIEGNARSGGSITLGASTSELRGTAFWTTGFSANPAATYDAEEQISGVETPPSAASTVEAQVNDLSTNNDNAGAPIGGSPPRLQYTAGTVTLSSGDYYLNKIDASGGKVITFDTTGGDITVGVENGISMQQSDIEVLGSGTVRIYVKDDIALNKGVDITVGGDQVASQFWLYGTHATDFSAVADQSDPIRMSGVFYAPGNNDGNDDASADIKHAEIFGAVVAAEVDVETGGQVHYDEALGTVQPFPAGTNAPRVTYLHVSVNRVNITAR